MRDGSQALEGLEACCCRYNGSPIMDAVRHKHSEVVAFLKRNGAVLHHDKAKGKTVPLQDIKAY